MTSLPVFEFSAPNSDKIKIAFSGSARLVRKWDGIFRLVVNKAIKPWIKEQFAQQGALGKHGSWASLASSTAFRKKQSKGQILYETGRMYRDLTSTENQGTVSGLTMSFGSSVKYAKYHQTGTRKMPARRIIDPDETFKKAVTRQVTRGIAQYIRGYGFAVASSLDIGDVSASEAYSIGRAQLGG